MDDGPAAPYYPPKTGEILENAILVPVVLSPFLLAVMALFGCGAFDSLGEPVNTSKRR